jgi:hypothetical protein
MTSYGVTVVKVLLLINKANAFVELKSIEEAMSIMQLKEEIYLHSHSLGVCYSNRASIEDHNPEGPTDLSPVIQPNRILLVTITNVRFAVTADTLYTVFSKYGEVLRIICFPKSLGEQALVEF